MRKNCKYCNEPCKMNRVSKKTGNPIYNSVCSSCTQFPYRRTKGKLCELCGFVPVHRCQLDVDHKDGNKKNDDPSNLQTLCANCHRLKTQLTETPRIIEMLNKRYPNRVK